MAVARKRRIPIHAEWDQNPKIASFKIVDVQSRTECRSWNVQPITPTAHGTRPIPLKIILLL
jgi:hypothetical protein